jgi:translocation and assembly module TamB
VLAIQRALGHPPPIRSTKRRRLSDETPTPPARTRVRLRPPQFLLIVAAALLVLVLVVGLGGRYGVLSPAGRDLVSSFVNGKKLGRYGRINVYGLKGDLFDDFTLDRVTVTDAKGVWLDARKVRVDWSYWALVNRRFHATLIAADKVQLIRRPELEAEVKPPGPMPLAIDIDRFYADVELLEGFSKEYGRWSLSGETDIERVGAKSGKVRALSRNRPGDYLNADFSIGGPGGLKLDAEAFEAKGGPIAGSLGYSPDQPFVIDAKAGGALGKGDFHAVVRTGAFTPLLTSGRWDKAGAVASGHIVFAGSDLLTPFAKRLGPEARFGMAGRQAKPDRWAMGWVLHAENLDVTARGYIDPKTRRSVEGVDIDLSTPSAAKLVGDTLGGPAKFRGRFTGDPQTWKVAGNAELSRLAVQGYGLQRIGGPIEARFAKGRYDVEANLQGAGGSGRSVIAGLLGARPTAKASLAILPDGSMLLQQVDATGAGLRLKGAGSRGLLGGLSFKGEASVTNAGVLRPGAKGSLGATVAAAQAGPGKAWAVTFDARGKRFSTGLGQLDRLLGAEPRLQGSGALNKDQVEIEHVTLTGVAGRVGGKGVVGLKGKLALLLDWSAKGPFHAGPVELAGNVKGSGALTGTFAAPRADLKAAFDQIDAGPLTLTQAGVTLTFAKDPRGFDGKVAIAGASNYGPARARSAFRFAGDGVRLSDLDLDAGGVQAKGALALRRGAPSSADLSFTAGPGAFLTAGSAHGVVRLVDGSGNTMAVLDIEGAGLQPRGSTYVFNSVKLKGQGTLERLPFTLNTDVGGATPVKFDGSGLFTGTGKTQTLSLDGAGAVRGAAFKTLAPLVIALAPDGKVARADLSIGGGRLTGEARQGAASFDATAKLTGINLRALNDNVAGKVNADLVLNGRGKQLGGNLDATFEGVRSRQGPRRLAVNGAVKAVLAGDRLKIDANASDKGGVTASTTLDLPVVASAAPLRLAVVKTESIAGRYAISGEIQPIWDLLMGGDRSLSGQVESHGALAGTLNAPSIQGQGTVRSGKFEDAALGLVLKDLTIDADFDRNLAHIGAFSATDAKNGKISGDGTIDLKNGAASTFQLALKNFQLIDNDLANARATGPVTVTRAADGKLQLKGALVVDRAEIAPNPPTPSGVVRMDVVEINAPPGRKTFEAKPAGGVQVALDVTLKAPRRVFVQGRGLDVELSLDAHVGGTSAAPQLTGTAKIVRGDFEFAGKRFEFDERGQILLSTKPEAIRLDLRATREDPTLTAVVVVRGTAAKPEILLTSTPALPQDEVLAQVLFGRSASQLSGIEAAQLASAVASLAGGGGFDVLGNLREFAGLDRLTFGGDATSGLTVAGGKYVADNVYLELIGGGREGPAVEVQWRVKRRLSVISRITGQGNAKLSVRWRKDLR